MKITGYRKPENSQLQALGSYGMAFLAFWIVEAMILFRFQKIYLIVTKTLVHITYLLKGQDSQG